MSNDDLRLKSVAYDKAYALAIRIVKAYKYLKESKKEFILSKQLLRSGTSVGANIAEANGAISDAEFFSKISIAYNYITLNINNKQQQQWLYFFLLSKVTITQILYSFTSIMVYS